MTRWRILLLNLTLLLAAAAPAEGAPLAEPGAILPLQDRVGDPATAAMLERLLIAELSRDHALLDTVGLRDALRRMRIRDAAGASPDQMERLGTDSGAGWFFSATLHRATVSRVPEITLSARAVRAGRKELAWAGFESASGLDARGWLERGRIDDLEILAGLAVKRLVKDFTLSGRIASAPPPRPEHSRTGYLAGPALFDKLRSVAVVPFDAVTDVDATVVAETVTDLAMALLHRRGVAVVSPGLVSEIQRRHGALFRGEVDARTRSAFWLDAAADHVLTGRVERYEVRGSAVEPEPRIALSARLIDAWSGRIVWIDGLERWGWDRQRLFRTGRVYAAGALAEEVMNALLAGPLEQAGVYLPRGEP
jgi:TolB-like protein